MLHLRYTRENHKEVHGICQHSIKLNEEKHQEKRNIKQKKNIAEQHRVRFRDDESDMVSVFQRVDLKCPLGYFPFLSFALILSPRPCLQ
jgi:hypothetical protein